MGPHVAVVPCLMSADVSVSRDVAADADVVWELVADLPRMGEWSVSPAPGTDVSLGCLALS